MDSKSSNPTITFEKHIQSSKQPSRKFILKPLTEEFVLPAARLVAQAYCRENPLLFGLEEETYYNSVGFPLSKYNASAQLGVICIEVSTGELVGVHLSEDYAKMEVDPAYVQHPLVDERLNIYDLAIKDNEQFFKDVPRGQFDTIWAFDVALRSDVENLGLFEEIVKFAAFEHPIIKKAKVLAIDAVHPASHRSLEQMGFCNIWHKRWAEFKNVPGYESFVKFPSIKTTGCKEKDNFGYSALVIDRRNTVSQDKNIKPKL